MKYLSLRQGRRYLRFLIVGCLSFVLTINGPALAAFKEIHQQSFDQTGPQQTTISQAASSFLQDGIEFYQAEQFSAAIDAWNRALTGSTDGLQKALLFSNLSLAYQHLGQWEPAGESIAQSLLLLKDLADLPESSDYWETVGKALNTQGRLQWTKGDAESALSTWRHATAAYHQAGHGRGIVLSLINQAKALQVLGLHRQSVTVLKQGVYQFLQSEHIDPPLKATGLWHLGNAQRQFGKLTESQTYLQKSLEIIDTYQLESLRSQVLIDLGNTERALGDSSSAIGKTDEADSHRKSALEAYRGAANSTSVPMTQLQADLNQLSLLIALEQWPEAEELWPTLLSKLNLSPSRSAIYTELNFAYSVTHLMQLDEPQANEMAAKQTIKSIPTAEEIDSILVKAIQQADGLDDAIAKSYALGQRGELYEVTKKWSAAQDFTQKALQLTTTNAYPDGRYRWQWQQGRLLNKQHKRDEAIAAYGAAVKTLQGVRSNLRFIDSEVQFSFRDNVEPVYRELAELLLIDDDNVEPTEENLDQAITQIDNLQLSELENFLRCDLAPTTTITKFEANSNTAILYPMILENHLTVILQLPEGKRFAKTDIPRAEVDKTLAQLRSYLSDSPSRTPDVRLVAQDVYKWLILPFEEELQRRDQLDTLVFVLDGTLRNIPMSVLHDGEQYLIEKYAIAVAPELKLFTPRSLPPDLQVFTGGVGTPQEIEGLTFEPIEKLDAELDVVSELFGPQPPLTNQAFKGETLKEQLSTGTFSGIHLKTHGVFSSDPEETFIVAYGELLKGEELGNLIQAGSLQGATPIDLLVLSSCSTAAGDNRAVLGLAGITVRAGARSTLSTLWEAQDDPNTELMIQFYRELKKDGMTRAKALRNAQLALINQGYRAPNRWATYVLVGNWL